MATHLPRRVTAAALGAGLAVLGIVGPASSAHAGPTSDPARAAQLGAAWVASQIREKGFLPSPTDATKADLNSTAYGVLALAAAKAGAPEAEKALAHLKTNRDAYIVTAGADAPGPIATLILAATATGKDPRTFFGTDLVARLKATEQASGLYGTADPTYDGAYRQGLALAALAAVGESDAEALAWLRDQQCDNGGWVPFRASTTVPCPAADPANFTGPDTNSTAMAVMAIAAQKASPRVDPLPWFASTKGADGGWAFVPSPTSASDANSTALSIQAVRVLGGSVTAPLATLLSFQIGCEGGLASAGAFAYQPDRGELTANALATVQAVPAAAGAAVPVPTATLAAETDGLVCPAAAPAAETPRAGAVSAGGIAATGSASDGLVRLAGVLVMAGGALVVAAGRRRCDAPD